MGLLRHDQQLRSIFSLLLLLLVLPSCVSTRINDWQGVTITGKIFENSNLPVSEAYVYAYREGRSNTLGPADAMSEPTDEDGVYMLILPEGTYTIVARKRLSGSISGPLKSGDMYGQLSKPLDTGLVNRTHINISMRMFRPGAEEDPNRVLITDTRITGTVVGTDGEVLPGIHVFAYEGSFRPDPPDYLSRRPTDAQGKFEISLPGAGLYIIGARTGLRGRPEAGDYIGFWGEKDKPREIAKGAVTKGVRIVVKPYGGRVNSEK